MWSAKERNSNQLDFLAHHTMFVNGPAFLDKMLETLQIGTSALSTKAALQIEEDLSLDPHRQARRILCCLSSPGVDYHIKLELRIIVC